MRDVKEMFLKTCKRWPLSAALILILFFLFEGVSLAQTLTQNVFNVTAQNLEDTASVNLMKVEEFKYLRKEAERLHLRVYLFGGTAAGYLHYVKWDLLRHQGDQRFQADRFDYDFTNIYRSTQDLDLVVDGPPEKAKEFERNIAQNFPYFMGSKSQWEVSLLR